MTKSEKYWMLSNVILAISAGMTIYGAFYRNDPPLGTWINAIFLIFVLLMQLWAYRFMKRMKAITIAKKEVTARDLATNFKPRTSGIDMTDINRELDRDTPCRNADHKH